MSDVWGKAARFWALAFTLTGAATLIVRLVGARMLHFNWSTDVIARYVAVQFTTGEMITIAAAWIVYAAVLTVTERPDAPAT